MPSSMVGSEVEIRPLRLAKISSHQHHGPDRPQHLAHVAVVRRPLAGGEVPSLVFPELSDGGYELFCKGHPEAVALRVDVVGGEVTTTDWPG
jgi:hypothetical protein